METANITIGSEKQINWANDIASKLKDIDADSIREEIVDVLKEDIEYFSDLDDLDTYDYKDIVGQEMDIERFDKIVNSIETEQDASWWIDNRSALNKLAATENSMMSSRSIAQSVAMTIIGRNDELREMSDEDVIERGKQILEG